MRVLEVLAEGQESISKQVEAWRDWEADELRFDGELHEGRMSGEDYDAVVGSHVLQLVERGRVVDVLKQWARWLKDGGEVHVIVPDLLWACEGITQERDADRWTMGVIYGWNGEHRCGFTVGTLRGAMVAAGLTVKAARLGPYMVAGTDVDGEYKEVMARQAYVVGVKSVKEEVSDENGNT